MKLNETATLYFSNDLQISFKLKNELVRLLLVTQDQKITQVRDAAKKVKIEPQVKSNEVIFQLTRDLKIN